MNYYGAYKVFLLIEQLNDCKDLDLFASDLFHVHGLVVNI